MPLQKSTRKKLQEPLSWCNSNSPGSCMVQFVSVECTRNVCLSQNHPLDLASGVNCLQRNLFDDTINDETVLGVGTSLVGHIYPDWASKVNMTCIRISISKTIRTWQKKKKDPARLGSYQVMWHRWHPTAPAVLSPDLCAIELILIRIKI